MSHHKFLDGGRQRQMLIRAGSSVLICLGLALASLSQEAAVKPPPVQVTIQDEKPVVIEPSTPVDPVVHAQVSTQNNMLVNIRVDQKTMHLGVIQTVLKIDGQVHQPGNFRGRFVNINQALPPQAGKKNRIGFMSVQDYNKIQITQIVEVVPTKPATTGAKRRQDAMMVTYLIDNKDTQPHQVGVKVWMDMFLVDNDGALFAAPNRPKQILDGVELKDKDVPDYSQVLQRPNLANPGYVAHFTYNLGRNLERPNRIVMTSLGGAFGMNGWDMQVMQAMGDSAFGMFWDPKEIPAGKKRSIAYGYGEGICPIPEAAGQFTVGLSGSFEPGQLFTIKANLQDAAAGQYLTLELPPGMERVEGKQLQPVGTIDENGNALVEWRARVLQTGRFPLIVRSSTGMTQTKIITITRPGGGAATSGGAPLRLLRNTANRLFTDDFPIVEYPAALAARIRAKNYSFRLPDPR